ncbi:MAG TPA: prepilin-type N-terminal cleavage/methylation domain-containing protein [Gemmatimonadales bacterium]|nr:prepilin-type N-terminal cleavage/methylation domain-containing protein [Gemmatimonadales bacterium]
MTPQIHVAQPSGFTLIEVLVSMTILSVASLAMGSMLVRSTRAAGATSSAAHQTAAMSGTVARLDVLPFDALVAGTTCVTITAVEFPHTQCTTINNVSPKVKLITVVITPSGNLLMQPVTTQFRRTISGNGNPLKTQ